MYTCDEVAERYKVKIITVWDWIRQRKLNAIKLGREYRISEEDLIEFENERKTIQTKHQITYLQQMKQVQKKGGSRLEIAVGLYIVGITLIMGYLINKYPRETIAIIFLYIMVLLQVVQKYFQQKQ